MAWRVRSGVTVDHSGKLYTAGQAVPCTDEQAAAMPHAVEHIETTDRLKRDQERMDRAISADDAPQTGVVTMQASTPKEAMTTATVETKKRGK